MNETKQALLLSTIAIMLTLGTAAGVSLFKPLMAAANCF
jgi:hypothetical protein